MQPPRRQQLSDLHCIVVDGGPQPRIPVVILHGYGADAENLATLAMPWVDELGNVAEAFSFIFPDAPSTLEELGMPDGRAWWPINMSRLMTMVQAERFEELHDHAPPGLETARAAICDCIEAAIQQITPEGSPPIYALGGFSQGAMLSMDVALRGRVDPPAALFLFSGTLICREDWAAAMPRLTQTRIIQSHGTYDPVLPYSSAEALSTMMKKASLDTTFCSFAGPHTIGGDSIQRSAEVLRSIAG